MRQATGREVFGYGEGSYLVDKLVAILIWVPLPQAKYQALQIKLLENRDIELYLLILLRVWV